MGVGGGVKDPRPIRHKGGIPASLVPGGGYLKIEGVLGERHRFHALRWWHSDNTICHWIRDLVVQPKVVVVKCE